MFHIEDAEDAEKRVFIFGWALSGVGERYMESVELDGLTEQIIGCAIAVHRVLGPGLLESTYEACLAHELGKNGFHVAKQEEIAITYKSVRLDCGYRVDLLVNDRVIVELKSIEKLQPVHKAQLITYLRLADKPVGLLINFNESLLKDGIARLVNSPGKSKSPRPLRPRCEQ
jgi:GxxExxY protein